MPPSESLPSIPRYEKVAACLIVCLVLVMTLIHIVQDHTLSLDTDPAAEAEQPYLQVTIWGEVDNPGTYQVKRGTVLGDVIKMAKPGSQANLKGIKLEAPIIRKRVIRIKKLPAGEAKARKSQALEKKDL